MKSIVALICADRLHLIKNEKFYGVESLRFQEFDRTPDDFETSFEKVICLRIEISLLTVMGRIAAERLYTMPKEAFFCHLPDRWVAVYPNSQSISAITVYGNTIQEAEQNLIGMFPDQCVHQGRMIIRHDKYFST